MTSCKVQDIRLTIIVYLAWRCATKTLLMSIVIVITMANNIKRQIYKILAERYQRRREGTNPSQENNGEQNGCEAPQRETGIYHAVSILVRVCQISD